jgi:enoyl-[acyl-carrier-protein] reductase (NADH)
VPEVLGLPWHYLSRGRAAEIEAAGAKCLALKCDVTKEEQIEQAVAATVKEFGRLDYAAYVDRTTSSCIQTDPSESATRLV